MNSLDWKYFSRLVLGSYRRSDTALLIEVLNGFPPGKCCDSSLDKATAVSFKILSNLSVTLQSKVFCLDTESIFKSPMKK
jgi:hypothetical protein